MLLPRRSRRVEGEVALPPYVVAYAYAFAPRLLLLLLLRVLLPLLVVDVHWSAWIPYGIFSNA